MYWHFRLGQLYPSEVSQKCTSFICYLICLFDEQFHNAYLQICPLTCSHFWRCSQHVFTSLASPRPVFTSLDLSQLPCCCPSLAMSSGWSSPEFLLSPESLCRRRSPSVVTRAPAPSEFLVLGVPCPWSPSEILREASSCLPRAFPLFPYDFIFLS